MIRSVGGGGLYSGSEGVVESGEGGSGVQFGSVLKKKKKKKE